MFKLKQVAGAAALVAGLTLAALPASAAPTISFGAAVVNGSNIEVDVIVADLGNDIVATYDIDVQFDASTLAFDGFAFGLGLGDEALFEVFNIGPFESGGVVDVAAVSLLSDDDLFALQGGGPVTLGTLKFLDQGQQGDVSSLLFVNWGDFNDVKGRRNQVLIPGGNVPEPATYALTGLALAGLLASRLARRRASATSA